MGENNLAMEGGDTLQSKVCASRCVIARVIGVWCWDWRSMGAEGES
jgi:hypothetical protein